jgi:hypothetical protein
MKEATCKKDNRWQGKKYLKPEQGIIFSPVRDLRDQIIKTHVLVSDQEIHSSTLGYDSQRAARTPAVLPVVRP